MATARFFSPGTAFVSALVLAAGLLARPAAVQAHAVYIFAWPEDGSICTESYFSKSGKVRGGEVRMENLAGHVLQRALTDDGGEVCFPAPKEAGELRFVVLAGEGHRGEFVLPASATAEAAAGAGEADTAASPPPQAARGNAETEITVTVPLAAEIRAIVREEMRHEIAPLRKALAEAFREDGPTGRDIIGGIGWIAGLAGFAALFASRKRGS